MAVERQLDPASLVARIVAELKANPEAQRLLLRTLLTNEFLGMPARLDRIEKDIIELKADVAQIKADVSQLKTDVAELKTDVAELKTDVAGLKTDVSGLKTDVSGLKTDVSGLKGSDLENRLHKRIRPLASKALDLRGAHVVQSPVQEPDRDFADHAEQALVDGRITDAQYRRIEATDFIMQARRRATGEPVWVAVEASSKVGEGDIQRARATADALHVVLDVDVLAMVAGYGIHPQDARRAKAAHVRYLEVSPSRPG